MRLSLLDMELETTLCHSLFWRWGTSHESNSAYTQSTSVVLQAPSLSLLTERLASLFQAQMAPKQH